MAPRPTEKQFAPRRIRAGAVEPRLNCNQACFFNRNASAMKITPEMTE